MAQKTNFNIFRLGNNKTITWKSKYIEQSGKELASYNLKNIEIKSYIEKFLKNQNLILQDYKININGYSVLIFVSYFATFKFIHNTENKINKSLKFKPRLKGYFKKNVIKIKSYKKRLKKNFIPSIGVHRYNINFTNFTLKKIKTPKRLKILRKYKDYLIKNKFKNRYNLNQHNFVTTHFIDSLKNFFGSYYQIRVIFKNLNKDNTLRHKYSKNELIMLKKNIAKLRRFKNSDFFKDGINTIYNVVLKKNSSQLLAEFVANATQKLKRHGQFFDFLKKTLNLFLFSGFSKLKGVKILFNGRISGLRRSKVIPIMTGNVKSQTIAADIEHHQATAYTKNGTIGVKVWVAG